MTTTPNAAASIERLERYASTESLDEGQADRLRELVASLRITIAQREEPFGYVSEHHERDMDCDGIVTVNANVGRSHTVPVYLYPAPPTSVGVDWRDLYRFQTAMRYMDANDKLTTQKADAMAVEDIARIERHHADTKPTPADESGACDLCGDAKTYEIEGAIVDCACTQGFPATPQPRAAAQEELRLFDSQWVNIVNHANCYAGWGMDEAIAHAVKLTEQKMAENARLQPAGEPEDAARYAWLRANGKSAAYGLTMREPEYWDAAIDAARRARGEGNG